MTEASRLEEATKNPHEELTLALEMQKDRPRSMYVAGDEKKDDDLHLPSDIDDDNNNDDEPIEEGQEAMWVDASAETPGGVATQKTPQVVSPSRASFFRGSTTGGSSSNKQILEASSVVDTQKSHVVLLPPTTSNTKPSPLDTVYKTKVAEKVEASRKLLEQALSLDANVGSRELLAQAAFEQAKEARRLVETTCTQELETILQDATTKGCAEVASVRQLQLQPQGKAAEDQNGDDGDDDEETPQAEHASRARNLLESILPQVEDIPAGKRTKSPDDISTLGFDNTFEDKTNSKDFDVLSMSSLNEILDGPLESPPAVVHRVHPPRAEATKDEEAEKKEEEEKKAPVTKASKVAATPPKKEAKRQGIFGGMFRSKTKGQQTPQKESAPVKKATKTSAATPERKLPAAKKPVKETEHNSSYVTKVVYEEGPTHPNGFNDQNSEEDAPDVVENLEKIKAVEEKMNQKLKAAIENDETESLTSYQGVPMHGKNEKRKEKKKKKNSMALGRNGGNEEEDAEEYQEGTVEVPPPTPPRKSPARDFSKVKPKFVAAPKGEAAILTARSWDSLMSDEEERKKYEAQTAVILTAPETPQRGDTDDESNVTPIKPPASPVESEAVGDDRYAVMPGEDRYAVDNEEASEAVAFGNFLDQCVPSKLSLVHGSETCSTLGLVSCLDPAMSEGDQMPRVADADGAPVVQKSLTDKYAQAADDPVEDEAIEAVSQLEKRKAKRSSAKKAPKIIPKKATEAEAKKDHTPPKQRKLRSGFFGFRRGKSANSGTPAKASQKKTATPKKATPVKTPKRNATPKKQKKKTTPLKKSRTPTKGIAVTVIDNAPVAPVKAASASVAEPANRMAAENVEPELQGRVAQEHVVGEDGAMESVAKENMDEENVAKENVEAENIMTMEHDGTGDVAKQNVPEPEQLTDEELEAEDPLVARLKEEKSRQSKRGMDPSSRQLVPPVYRGIDP